MAITVISLDEQETARLEQVIIDEDEKGAWELLKVIRKKVRAARDTTCGLEKLRKGTL
jgi:hypothetical protein